MGLFDFIGPIIGGPTAPKLPGSPRLHFPPKLPSSSPDILIKSSRIESLAGNPVPGSPVYCNLAVVAEHTGIYIGDDEIVHLNGDGNIEIVSPREFVSRLDGLNPAVSIYCASRNGKALGKNIIANRARSMVGSTRNYQVVFDNCHQFTCGCISGNFENPCNFFWMVETEIRDKFGSFTWAEWDY